MQTQMMRPTFVLGGLMISAIACLPGCGRSAASADIDAPLLMKRVKDGVFEVVRRHQTGPNETLMLVESLRDRIFGYEDLLETCDPDAAETIGQIVESLDAIAAERPAGTQLGQSLDKLVGLAETLPVEATPAEAYDD